ncbi:flagellum-associated coiled-coil domain-containing protein 1 [Rhynchonycteris naso]
MYPNPLIYCTCWDPWNLGPQKLTKTPHPPQKTCTGKPKLTLPPPNYKKQNDVQPTGKPIVSPKVKIHLGKQEESKHLPSELIDVLPGYHLFQNRKQISVTLRDEMSDRKKRLKSEIMDKVKIPRTDIITDLEEQISELTAIIEQMNRDHQSAEKLLSNKMELHCAKMKQDFEKKNRELKEAHAAELRELENNCKEALKAEKLAAQEKLEEMEKEYKYLKNMFHIYQDSIHDEMEDKWSQKKAKWEKDEKLEWEKILLQQKRKITKKFELESEEEKRKLNDSYSSVFENINQEKEELLKQHEKDTLQLEELKKAKEILEEELHAQAVILESLNSTLYQTQMELKRERAVVGNLEKTLQTKLAKSEEGFKYAMQQLSEENSQLRQKIITKNEDIYVDRSRSTCITIYEKNSETSEDGSNKRQEL